MRTVGTVAVNRIGARSPYRVVPRRADGLYARSLHHEHEGEWETGLHGERFRERGSRPADTEAPVETAVPFPRISLAPGGPRGTLARPPSPEPRTRP